MTSTSAVMLCFAAEVEHLLGFGDAADGRAGETAAADDQAECRDAQGLLRCADKGEVAVEAEQVEIGVDVVIGGDGVEDEIEAAGVLLHLVGIAGDDDFVGTEAERVFLLVGRGGEDDDVGSERMSELHAHVAQSAETDHADLLALGDAPVAHGRVGCDPGAEERRGSGEIEVGGNAQDEAFIDDDAVGVATVGDASEVLVRGVVGEGQVRAELLKASLALRAGAVRVDHAADRGEVAGLVLRDCRADLGDTADDLMAGNDRVDRGHDARSTRCGPMEIGVADAAEEDFDLHVVFGWIAPRDRGGGQRRCRTGGGVSFCVVHK